MRSGLTYLFVATVVVLAALVVAATFITPSDTAGPCTAVQGPANIPELPEASGVAVSRRDPALLWSHNDSGNAPVLFALDASGAVRGRVRVPVFLADWEDISAAPCPAGDCLYIGDIGDNGFARRSVQVYRVAEPDPQATTTARPDVFNLTYADGPHNAEAMLVVGNDLVVIAKDRSGGVYRGTVPPSTGELTMRRIGQLGLEAVTDAEASPDGQQVVVRNSREAAIYQSADLLRGGDVQPVMRIPIAGLKEPQGEGVALGNGGMLYLTSEGTAWNRAGRLLSLRCTERRDRQMPSPVRSSHLSPAWGGSPRDGSEPPPS